MRLSLQVTLVVAVQSDGDEALGDRPLAVEVVRHTQGGVQGQDQVGREEALQPVRAGLLGGLADVRGRVGAGPLHPQVVVCLRHGDTVT